MSDNKTFVILGMHRSATSLIAKSINTQISMGDNLLPPDKSNPHGHFEDLDFLSINKRILRSAGGNWRNPPTHKAILSQSPKFEQEIKNLIQSKNKNSKLWGWKDPRTSLTIPLFHNHLSNPHYIYIQRDPNSVAQSLHRRNNIPIEEGLYLYKIYNKRIKDFLEKTP